MRLRRGLGLLIAGLALVPCSVEWVNAADNVRPASTSPPLRFRRIYAPIDRVQDWPTGSARYVPVDGEEFERLVRSAQGSQGSAPPAATLVRAQYDAQLDGDQLSGTLQWDVERIEHADSDSFVSLAPMNLALGPGRWRGAAARRVRQRVGRERKAARDGQRPIRGRMVTARPARRRRPGFSLRVAGLRELVAPADSAARHGSAGKRGARISRCRPGRPASAPHPAGCSQVGRTADHRRGHPQG